jgi:protein SCO1
MMRRLVRLGAALLVTVSFGAGCGNDAAPAPLVGYQLEPAATVGDLALPDAATGQPVSLHAAANHLLVVNFGYTSCPDVCPTTMAAVKAARNRLGPDGARIEVAMITIDPARDAQLAQYVASFAADGHGLRTTVDADLRAVADRFGADYSVTAAEDGTIEVTHTGSVYVVDQTGAVVLTWPFGVSSADMANDLSILLESSSA